MLLCLRVAAQGLVLVCCHTKYHRPSGLETEVCCLTGLELRNPKSRCQQGLFLLRQEGKGGSLPGLSVDFCLHVHMVVSLCVSQSPNPPHPHFLWGVVFFFN